MSLFMVINSLLSLWNISRKEFRPRPAYKLLNINHNVITGPPNGPVLFCRLSSVVVCNEHWRSASSGRHCMVGQYGYVLLRRHLVKRVSLPPKYIYSNNTSCITTIIIRFSWQFSS